MGHFILIYTDFDLDKWDVMFLSCPTYELGFQIFCFCDVLCMISSMSWYEGTVYFSGIPPYYFISTSPQVGALHEEASHVLRDSAIIARVTCFHIMEEYTCVLPHYLIGISLNNIYIQQTIKRNFDVFFSSNRQEYFWQLWHVIVGDVKMHC